MNLINPVKNNYISILTITLTIIASFYLLLFPLHITTDGAYYLMGADNLAKGNGFYAFNIFALNRRVNWLAKPA